MLMFSAGTHWIAFMASRAASPFKESVQNTQPFIRCEEDYQADSAARLARRIATRVQGWGTRRNHNKSDHNLWKHPQDGLVQTLESGEMNGDFPVEITLVLRLAPLARRFSDYTLSSLRSLRAARSPGALSPGGTADGIRIERVSGATASSWTGAQVIPASQIV